jgi:hypothetical protein
MGTWGAGNFDNDTAADGLGELTGDLIAKITAEFADESGTSLEPDEWGGEMVPVWLELLSDIAEPGRVGAALPPSATLAGWRDRFLEVWEETIDDLDPDEDYKAERREVLQRTFARAIGLAEERERAA